jgi:hypothetical protein
MANAKIGEIERALDLEFAKEKEEFAKLEGEKSETY